MLVTQKHRLTGTEVAADRVVVHMLLTLVIYVGSVGHRTKVHRFRYGWGIV
jgi:hypothetical protein